MDLIKSQSLLPYFFTSLLQSAGLKVESRKVESRNGNLDMGKWGEAEKRVVVHSFSGLSAATIPALSCLLLNKIRSSFLVLLSSFHTSCFLLHTSVYSLKVIFSQSRVVNG